jgi:membrane protein
MSDDVRQEQRPPPDDDEKPDSPGALRPQTWRYVLRKTVREFQNDQCTDLAAGLTYYAVLAIFPAAIALVSLVGVVGQAQQSVQKVTDVLQPLVSPNTLNTIQPVLQHLAESQAAGFGLVIGVVGALWSASAYVSAFGRAMNKVYEIPEGRPFWKLRPLMLVITAVVIVLVACLLVLLVVSGPLADSLGSVLGLGSQAVTAWRILRWPVMVLVVIMIVALLYHVTPNVKQPKFRWLSVGAVVAIVVWVLASVAFAFYVANFGTYNRTYGALAGAIVGLLWLWITNLALLFGAELDSELERGRELQAGIEAEHELQLPLRDTRGVRKGRKKEQKDIDRGRAIREQATENEQATEKESSR